MLKPTKINRHLPEAIMKTLKPAFLIMLITLSGCAHHAGYQRSYVGYGGGYGTGYYDYPYRSYYQSSPIIYYDRHYMPTRPLHHHDWDKRHYSSPRNWRPSNNRNDSPRWKPNVSGKNIHRSDSPKYRSQSFNNRPMKGTSNPDRSQRRSNYGNVRREGHGRSEHYRRGK